MNLLITTNPYSPNFYLRLSIPLVSIKNVFKISCYNFNYTPLFLTLFNSTSNLSIKVFEAIYLFIDLLSRVGTTTGFSTSTIFYTILGIWTILGNLIKSVKRPINYSIKIAWALTYGALAFRIDPNNPYNPFLKFVHKLM